MKLLAAESTDMAKLFDTHAHYTDERLFGDDALLSSVFAADVSHILTVATDLTDSKNCIALAKEWDGMYASAGIHPHEAAKVENLDDAMTELDYLLHAEKVVALGEIGLDYYYDFADRDTQIALFRAQMDVAAKTGKPVLIHDRDAHGDTMDIIREYAGRVRGILHSCSASAEQVKEYVKMGWYISFSGVITFKNASKVLDSVLATPPSHILVETDCPYLAPVPMRGKTNHSGYMHFTAEKAASLLGMDSDTFCETEVKNAMDILGISPK